jgi:hypothetical protein
MAIEPVVPTLRIVRYFMAKRPMTIQTAKRLVVAIRDKWPAATDVVQFQADILLTDSKGNTLRVQIVGVPPGDLVDLRHNDKPIIAYLSGNINSTIPTSE